MIFPLLVSSSILCALQPAILAIANTAVYSSTGMPSISYTKPLKKSISFTTFLETIFEIRDRPVSTPSPFRSLSPLLTPYSSKRLEGI